MNVNQEFIARWADALESGEYPQTYGRLHRLYPTFNMPDGYCCVGVACVIAGIDKTLDYPGYRFDGQVSRAPESLRYLAGEDVDWTDLISRNDGLGKYLRHHSFVEIAQHLRETYLTDDVSVESDSQEEVLV